MFSQFLIDYHIGQLLINFIFASSVVSAGAYFFSYRGNEQLRAVGRGFFIAVFLGLMLAAALMMHNILNHDFRYFYVYNYSSTELPLHLLMATFYAGQEGSFLLWTILVSGIGMALLPYVRRMHYESQVMSFYSLILMFLMVLMVAKSPFAYIWEHFANEPNVFTGFMPANGRGLNPLLHNSWITIHPPILFTGFAAMSVPFAFAMAGLARREYQQWVKIALPWTLFGTAVLGFGIMLGGFWAYETLGWGGFWGWDPVENSSLIPWLVCVALVHTMLTQRRTGGLVRSNFVLAIAAFVLVLYSTFLTRSGVLGDTSVHSFVDPGMFAFVLLIVFMSVFTLIGAGGILYRMKDIGKGAGDFNMSSREFLLAIGAVLVLFSACLVLMGTSYPIIAELIGKPKAAIPVTFYNLTHLPLVIVIVLVNAVSLTVRWRSTKQRDLLRELIAPGAVALVATVVLALFGLTDVQFLLLAFGSFLTLFVNMDKLARLLRRKPGFTGAYVSHIGVALLFLGIIALAQYSTLEHVRLVQGKAVEALGYTFTYLDRVQIEKEFTDREKYKYRIQVSDGDNTTVVEPILYYSDYNQRQSPFLEPGIRTRLLGDVYVAPKAIEVEGLNPSAALTKNTPVSMPIDSGYTLILKRFDMSGAMAGAAAGRLRMGVEVDLAHKGDTTNHMLYSTMTSQTGEWSPEAFALPGTSYYIALQRINPNREDLSRSEAVISFADTEREETMQKDVFVAEVSHKPFISLVWGGVIFMVVGFFISIARRTRELKAPAAPQSPAEMAAEAPDRTTADPTHANVQ